LVDASKKLNSGQPLYISDCCFMHIAPLTPTKAHGDVAMTTNADAILVDTA
jgi:hypothetical protein